MGSIYVICSRQCPNGDGIYTLLYALYKYSTSITNQPTNQGVTWMHSLSPRGVPVRQAGWACQPDAEFKWDLLISKSSRQSPSRQLVQLRWSHQCIKRAKTHFGLNLEILTPIGGDLGRGKVQNRVNFDNLTLKVTVHRPTNQYGY